MTNLVAFGVGRREISLSSDELFFVEVEGLMSHEGCLFWEEACNYVIKDSSGDPCEPRGGGTGENLSNDSTLRLSSILRTEAVSRISWTANCPSAFGSNFRSLLFSGAANSRQRETYSTVWGSSEILRRRSSKLSL